MTMFYKLESKISDMHLRLALRVLTGWGEKGLPWCL